MSGLWRNEWRLLSRLRLTVWLLVVLTGISALAVTNGLTAVARQRAEITKLIPLQQGDLAHVRAQYALKGEAGYAAYFGFQLTWDSPTPLAFAALGQRDFAPFVLRVRALALQAQLHDSETFNPESALAGRFDFAFVLIFLAPLFVIVLFHDLFSGEREAGRWRSLAAMPKADSLWRRRALLRYFLVAAATLSPLIIGMLISRPPVSAALAFMGVAAGYLAFWCLLSYWLASRTGSSVAHATRLLGAWVALTIAIPVLASLVINRATPAESGVDLALAHREAVHGAWEIPREETMRRFVETHPEWKSAAALGQGFQWKWYFAFHQNADESVVQQFQGYRESMFSRERAMRGVGWAVPPVGAQSLLHRLANTDLSAQLRYQDSISAFHARLRAHYYQYLFGNVTFNEREFDRAPVFQPREK